MDDKTIQAAVFALLRGAIRHLVIITLILAIMTAYLKAALADIAAGPPAARIDGLMQWKFEKQT